MDKVYIILPVHNRRSITESFINLLKIQTYQNYHLILVDDGSTDGTAQMVQEQIQSLTVIRGDGNLWWAGSLQQGINWLKQNNTDSSDIVLMINDDVTFDKCFLEKAVQILKGQERTLMLAASSGNSTGNATSVGMNIDFSRPLQIRLAEVPDEINCLSTRGLFLRFVDLVNIGNFYPKILPHYLSDYEFTIRAFKKGYKLTVSYDFNAVVNEETTGFYNFQIEHLDFLSFIKKIFSKKSLDNPIDWTVFIILVSRKIVIPLYVLKIWKRSIFLICKIAIREFYLNFLSPQKRVL
ncbi:glycosyltransferase [Aetokthonos hydrillicola Thurmond2011]|jgi:GT2 family glycosyltransferase|uniref:Glycosyltransferase n=1 Tax=Aetokthonos hydrillicola Thurmond2011 TaxID=2712845 RepID=A0AAP5M803_9CYAN|nr:glycosyltransferase [Aetokthonos hydrillicola]MBO3460962.1 glycosyltransferase family 2 protein [Aetokthonos hydrillicola CCALA 1050]MBW4583635.1 glycosyltransferase [Aetokthonos hydrillicola CCALA 1050]MDR9895670.1 glycosyltransferase [Aetokthonos hydrillicola Thurmond2011]